MKNYTLYHINASRPNFCALTKLLSARVYIFAALLITLVGAASCNDTDAKFKPSEGGPKPSPEVLLDAENFLSTYFYRSSDSVFRNNGRLTEVKDLNFTLMYKSVIKKSDQLNGFKEKFLFWTELEDGAEPVERTYNLKNKEWSDWSETNLFRDWTDADGEVRDSRFYFWVSRGDGEKQLVEAAASTCSPFFEEQIPLIREIAGGPKK